jgi:uncharacterized protein (DUF2062 family)
MKLKQYWLALKTAFYKELSWPITMRSTVCAVWIAFCPFVGLHTILAFFSSWLFSLNIAIVVGLSMLINNPWTMIPVYYFDYQMGLYWYFYVIGYIPENPLWLDSLLLYMQRHLLIPTFSLWAFIAGGIVVASIAAMITYTIFLWYAFFKVNSKARDQI